jgi:ferritin-like metal-binding protein YciE
MTGLDASSVAEHYEIARYGTLKTWARELGLNEAVKLLPRGDQGENPATIRMRTLMGRTEGRA